MAAAPSAAPPEGLYFSISALVMRPPGPVPLTDFKGTPFSRANAFAEGPALGSRSRLVSSLPPFESDSCASGAESFFSTGGGVVPELLSGGFDTSVASSFGASFEGAFSPPASSRVNDSNSEMSVPSTTMTAIGCNSENQATHNRRTLHFRPPRLFLLIPSEF